MASSQNFPGRTLQSGTTQLPDLLVPQGSTEASLTFDASQMVAGQNVLMICQMLDGNGVVVATFTSDTTGPYIDKHTGLLVTDVKMGPFGGWGVSGVQWKIRSSLLVTNGPIVIGGGHVDFLP